MRGFLAAPLLARRRRLLTSSIGVACAAALTLPLALQGPAHASAPAPASAPAAETLAGSTQSLPLASLGSDRAGGAGASTQGVYRRDVLPFSLVGVVWDNP
ncbi:hypothetical protein P8605_43430, partial [Streptomyces sp. T-3]|nr:hypothetical protein [Streptomyces sp. T-3]